MPRNLRLDICYDGTRYRGWQRLTVGEGTIQGKLETVLSRILEEPIEVCGSGRTDAGVHAAHQIANFHCENPMPPEKILRQLRRYLPEDIGIYSCEEAAPRFHARLNATGKTYRYRIWASDAPCVFQRRFVWADPEELDVAAMTVSRQGGELRITVTGNGFLYNMVRILVGTLVEVGRWQRTPESIPALFGQPREKAGFLAPPQGLCLMEVTY